MSSTRPRPRPRPFRECIHPERKCILGCGRNVVLFRFPHDLKASACWLEIINKPEFIEPILTGKKNPRSTYICIKHFSRSMLTLTGRRLTSCAVPDINLRQFDGSDPLPEQTNSNSSVNQVFESYIASNQSTEHISEPSTESGPSVEQNDQNPPEINLPERLNNPISIPSTTHFLDLDLTKTIDLTDEHDTDSILDYRIDDESYDAIKIELNEDEIMACELINKEHDPLSENQQNVFEEGLISNQKINSATDRITNPEKIPIPTLVNPVINLEEEENDVRMKTTTTTTTTTRVDPTHNCDMNAQRIDSDDSTITIHDDANDTDVELIEDSNDKDKNENPQNNLSLKTFLLSKELPTNSEIFKVKSTGASKILEQTPSRKNVRINKYAKSKSNSMAIKNFPKSNSANTAQFSSPSSNIKSCQKTLTLNTATPGISVNSLRSSHKNVTPAKIAQFPMAQQISIMNLPVKQTVLSSSSTPLFLPMPASQSTQQFTILPTALSSTVAATSSFLPLQATNNSFTYLPQEQRFKSFPQVADLSETANTSSKDGLDYLPAHIVVSTVFLEVPNLNHATHDVFMPLNVHDDTGLEDVLIEKQQKKSSEIESNYNSSYTLQTPDYSFDECIPPDECLSPDECISPGNFQSNPNSSHISETSRYGFDKCTQTTFQALPSAILSIINSLPLDEYDGKYKSIILRLNEILNAFNTNEEQMHDINSPIMKSLLNTPIRPTCHKQTQTKPKGCHKTIQCTPKGVDNFTMTDYQKLRDLDSEDELFMHTTLRPLDARIIKLDANKYECGVCKYVTNSLGIIQTHMQKHEEKCGLCYSCGKLFGHPVNLKTHEYRCIPEERQRRLEMRKMKENEDEEDSKFFIRHPSGTFECTICNQIFQKYHQIRKHRFKHGDRNFVCVECNRCFYNKYDLMAHHRQQHINLVKCEYCGKELKKYTYRRHLHVHEKAMQFKCEKCSRKFRTEEGLQIHTERKHCGNKIKRHSCTMCNVEFNNSVTVAQQKRHFNSNDHLENEINWKLKNNIEEFACYLCYDMKYEKFYDLIVHFRLHQVKVTGRMNEILRKMINPTSALNLENNESINENLEDQDENQDEYLEDQSESDYENFKEDQKEGDQSENADKDENFDEDDDQECDDIANENRESLVENCQKNESGENLQIQHTDFDDEFEKFNFIIESVNEDDIIETVDEDDDVTDGDKNIQPMEIYYEEAE